MWNVVCLKWDDPPDLSPSARDHVLEMRDLRLEPGGYNIIIYISINFA